NDGGDSVTNQKANEQPAPSGSMAPISKKKTEKASGNQTLPNTGQEALGSLLISLGGLVSLGMAVAVRRKAGE
ncbi:LPXTG cell wall anchor domain-containing protein, partial [Streptococcus suis]